jgi:hypothetical protein
MRVSAKSKGSCRIEEALADQGSNSKTAGPKSPKSHKNTDKRIYLKIESNLKRKHSLSLSLSFCSFSASQSLPNAFDERSNIKATDRYSPQTAKKVARVSNGSIVPAENRRFTRIRRHRSVANVNIQVRPESKRSSDDE